MHKAGWYQKRTVDCEYQQPACVPGDGARPTPAVCQPHVERAAGCHRIHDISPVRYTVYTSMVYAPICHTHGLSGGVACSNAMGAPSAARGSEISEDVA